MPGTRPDDAGDDVVITRADNASELPDWMDVDHLTAFLHESLKPYEDPRPVVGEGIEYAFSNEPGRGGFVLVASRDETLLGALVILKTGMARYVPENLLLFVAVSPDARGRGIGGRLVSRAVDEADGEIKLHVEHDNPARRLYERCGFSSKYLEMRHAA
ncbi:MAG: GNAT family N-acetyltransferase [Candidatus Eisenbacteria bacterium]|nr:GNAT family N-acetyltransferase [Candidatus Eisenbacteria bacterium]